MAGYSKTPLIGKLGLKPAMRVHLSNVPASVRAALEPLPEDSTLIDKLTAKTTGTLDFVHHFADQNADLARDFPALKAALTKTGMLWISWRKGKNGTDLTDNIVREKGIKEGLVDVKICAVDETWSGLKLVYRLKDR